MFSYTVKIKERGDTAWHELSGREQPCPKGAAAG